MANFQLPSIGSSGWGATLNGTLQNLNDRIVASGNQFDALQDIRYVAYGHSFGVQQTVWNTTAAGVYPARIRDDLGIDPYNYSNRTTSGQKADAMLAGIKGHWQRGWYGLVTMMITQNDAGSRTDPTSFKASIQGAIDWIRGPGQFPPTIVFIMDTYSQQSGYNRYNPALTDSLIDQYNQYIKDVVATYPQDGSIIIADANVGWDRNTMIAFDGQHPNDRGSAQIANAVETALMNAPFREGQNVGITAPSYFYDSFNRPDSSTIGAPMYNNPASTYTSFSTISGFTFGISGNAAARTDALSSTGESICVMNSGSSTVDISVTMDTITVKGSGPAWRAADINNYWVVDIYNTGVGNAKVYKRIGGTFTQVGSAFTIEVKNGDTVRVTHNSSGVITAYVNGSQAFTTTDNALSSNTMHGIRFVDLASNGGRLNDLIVK